MICFLARDHEIKKRNLAVCIIAENMKAVAGVCFFLQVEIWHGDKLLNKIMMFSLDIQFSSVMAIYFCNGLQVIILVQAQVLIGGGGIRSRKVLNILTPQRANRCQKFLTLLVCSFKVQATVTDKCSKFEIVSKICHIVEQSVRGWTERYRMSCKIGTR